MLKVNNLSVSYGKGQPVIIDNLFFSLEKGCVLNILGQNAVGKTTLIKCLTRELTEYKGVIDVDGIDIRNFSIKDYSKRVGVVASAFHSYQNLLVADYLVTGFINQLAALSRPSKQMIDKAYSILELFDKQQLFNRRIDQLSSGEKQLVMISRVMIQNPDIIIVDEPTANLDVKNQISVLEQIYQLSEKGYTVIITTHNPGQALCLGGKTLLMGKAKYLYGDTKEIINSSNLTEFYEIETQISEESDYQAIIFRSRENRSIKLVL